MYRVVKETPWEELERQVRAVHLLQPRNGKLVYPYKNAKITLAEIPYDSVKPTSLYLLSSHLQMQEQLASDLARQGYNPLDLRAGVIVQNKSHEPVGLIPPIVEETEEDGRYILDGMHRVYLGWRAGRPAFWAIHIKGIRADCPATARPNKWEEIHVYDKVPSNPSLKRRYRITDYLTLRRDFSALNGSKPRTN